jgi:hypothetical protein
VPGYGGGEYKNMTRRPAPTDKQRKTAAMTIVKVLDDELSVVAKPLSQVDIVNIPNRVEPAIRNWIRKHAGKHEVYGSGAMATHQITGRKPADLDLVITDPNAAARSLATVMRRGGVKCKVVPSQSAGAYIVQTYLRNEWQDALDIHPLAGHGGKFEFYGRSKSPMTKNGIRIQRAADQLLRKANSVTGTRTDGSMGAAPAREMKDTSDFVANARLLLASMETRTAAQTARAKRVRKAIGVWERHLKTIPGAPAKPKRKPVSKTRNTRFTQKARANPAVELDNLIFAGGAAVIEREVMVTPRDVVARDPYARDPYAGGSYADACGDPYADAKYVQSPCDQEFVDAIRRLEGRPTRTTRRKPRGTKKGKKK